MKTSALAYALLSVALLSGCATILNDKTQPINVTSSNGATFEGNIDGVAFKGPGIVNVVREKKDRVVSVTTPGCTPQTALPKSVDSKFFVNILSGGTFGSTTDYTTEEMWRYADNVVITCK